ETSREAVRLSHQLLQPSSQALALHFAAMLRQLRREGREALVLAELALAIASEQGFSFWQAGGTILRGRGLAEGGPPAEGVALVRKGLAAWDATGSVTYRTHYLALLAEALEAGGSAEAALAAVDEALELAGRTGERYYEAELHRLRGELLLRQVTPG